jgi:phosphoenolpyruvate-protein kinase (PTS system EI component)
MLSFSKEHGNFICKKLKDLEIINIVEGAFGRKLYVQDHMKLEAIPTSAEESSIGEEVKKFKDARKKNEERIKSIKEQQEKKRKDLFAELNRQLKDGLKTKK